MRYGEEYADNDGLSGDPQETDGINRGDEMGPSGSEAQRKFGVDDIVGEINAFLQTSRFPGDICITLKMPDSYLKKAKDKVNLAIWQVYNKYARPERIMEDSTKVPGFGMVDIVLALAPHVDANKFTLILENDIKQKMAAEKNIKITDSELDYVAKHPVKVGEKRLEEQPDIVDCPECGGTGEVNGKPCRLCLGEGKVRRVVEDVPSIEPDLSNIDIDMDQIDEIMQEMSNNG